MLCMELYLAQYKWTIIIIIIISNTDKMLRKVSFPLISTHIHALETKLSSLDAQLHK